MRAKRSKIASVVADKALKKGQTTQFSKEVAAYLLNERRANDLSSIMRDVQEAWAEAGYINVVATSAHNLTSEINRRIESIVKEIYPNANKIAIDHKHDLEVIGGVRLELAHIQLDLTIEGKLNMFKQLTI
jgi:F0F1-type ATP synthase delta subunit